jgi:hypothetical protein
VWAAQPEIRQVDDVNDAGHVAQLITTLAQVTTF